MYMMPARTYRPARGARERQLRTLVWVLAAVLLTNLATYFITHSPSTGEFFHAPPRPLYLIEEASRFVSDPLTFEGKVRSVAKALDIAPEWLMAVMYSESKFNPAVVNHRGSGATGLIQFMVPTVRELNDRMGTELYMSDIQRMSAETQMNLVYEYLQTVRERYGDFDNLTELYLAILYPRALDQDPCYSLYAKPSRAYTQNAGLDENGDGVVTVSDIDARMKRLYPEAYIANR